MYEEKRPEIKSRNETKTSETMTNNRKKSERRKEIDWEKKTKDQTKVHSVKTTICQFFGWVATKAAQRGINRFFRVCVCFLLPTSSIERCVWNEQNSLPASIMKWFLNNHEALYTKRAANKTPLFEFYPTSTSSNKLNDDWIGWEFVQTPNLF